jgi:uncharacterized protein
MLPQDAQAILDAIHDDVDTRARELSAEHGARLVCGRGCFGCCVDDLTVFAVEAAKIQARYPELLASGTPHPQGRCAFLGAEGECRVYEARPYVCRTQGLPLRWIDEEAEAEYRDICELNEAGAPIETLGESSCWTIGPVEARLHHLQSTLDDGDGDGDATRIELRSLFEKTPA